MIFNRRYAKCEACGTQLPVSIVLSAQEKALLLERESDEAEVQKQKQALGICKNSSGRTDLGGGAVFVFGSDSTGPSGGDCGSDGNGGCAH
jgi:hypothetical protein